MKPELLSTTAVYPILRCRGDEVISEHDRIIEEVPIALVYNGISHAVMLASPADFEDFAVGFSLSEGIVEHPREIHDLDIVPSCHGISVEITIATPRFVALKNRRRNLAGRTGCGLCGIDSLVALSDHAITATAQAKEPLKITAHAVDRSLQQLAAWQPLRASTGASHGAAWADLDGNIQWIREDVGRHNALDKLIGVLAQQAKTSDEHKIGDGGFVLITSRASYEMVQKSARVGVSAIVAVSAPTALAVRNAQAAGILLVGFARPGQRVVYTQHSSIRLVN